MFRHPLPKVTAPVGERPGRAATRPRPYPRWEAQPADAAPQPGNGDGLPPRWRPGNEDRDETCDGGHYGGLRGTPRRCPGQAARRGQPPRARAQPRAPLEEFRNYQQGTMPSGPGARPLIELFATIDRKLTQAPDSPA